MNERETGRRAWRPAVALGCALLSGCYSLQPVRMEADVAPGRVRAYLSDAGARRVAGPLGAERPVLDGRLVRADADELTLLVPSAGAAGFRSEVLYQELRIPRSEVDGLQRRQFDGMRTGLLVGGVAAVSGFLLYQALSGETGASGNPTGPGGVEARVPLLRLRLP